MASLWQYLSSLQPASVKAVLELEDTARLSRLSPVGFACGACVVKNDVGLEASASARAGVLVLFRTKRCLEQRAFTLYTASPCYEVLDSGADACRPAKPSPKWLLPSSAGSPQPNTRSRHLCYSTCFRIREAVLAPTCTTCVSTLSLDYATLPSLESTDIC